MVKIFNIKITIYMLLIITIIILASIQIDVERFDDSNSIDPTAIHYKNQCPCPLESLVGLDETDCVQNCSDNKNLTVNPDKNGLREQCNKNPETPPPVDTPVPSAPPRQTRRLPHYPWYSETPVELA